MIRFKSLKTLLVSAALAPVLAFGQGAGDQKLTPEVKADVIAKISGVIKNSAFVPGIDLAKWDDFIASQKEAIEKAETDTDFAAAVRHAIEKFGISHMVLMTPDAAKARIERKAVGIGITIQPTDDGLIVTSVFDETPAKEAGLQPGDLIFEADGKKLGATSTITGEEGTKVVLKIKRTNGKVDTLTLTRRKFSSIRPETLTQINPDTVLLRIPTFDISYNRKKVDELMAEARKSKNIILDLRSNGGGAVINMLHLMGYFLPPNTEFGLFISKPLVRDFVEETKGSPTDLKAIAAWAKRGWLKPGRPEGGPYTGNVAVLINGGTGSASEITAAAFKEFLDSPVVGTKSAGAVLVSTMAPVGNGWILQYPLSDYITKQGLRLEGNGVVPDVEAGLVKFGEPDVAVDKALALLKRIELRQKRAAIPPLP